MKSEPAICQEANAREGLRFLQLALESFKKSENKQTAARVRAAISSAKGAVRICGYRKHREPEETAPGSGMWKRNRPAEARRLQSLDDPA